MTNQEKQGQENAWQEVNPSTAKTWLPEEDKEIQGIYTGKKEKVGPNESNIYVLEVGGEKIGIWGSTLLDGRFAEIPMGNEVKIQYLGKKKSPKTNREYNDYLVMTRPRPFREVSGNKKDDEIPVIESESIPEDDTQGFNEEAEMAVDEERAEGKGW